MSLEDEEKPPVRVLKPTARFDSFVLWHQDIPVDEGKDEYLRSLFGGRTSHQRCVLTSN